MRILLNCKSVFSTLRRAGVRAKYSAFAATRWPGRGCGLDIGFHWQTGTVTAASGNALTIPEAAGQPEGWFRGGGC